MAPFDDVIAAALRIKHQAVAVSNTAPPMPSNDTCLSLLNEDRCDEVHIDDTLASGIRANLPKVRHVQFGIYALS
jgi:hypothetical protein